MQLSVKCKRKDKTDLDYLENNDDIKFNSSYAACKRNYKTEEFSQ